MFGADMCICIYIYTCICMYMDIGRFGIGVEYTGSMRTVFGVHTNL